MENGNNLELIKMYKFIDDPEETPHVGQLVADYFDNWPEKGIIWYCESYSKPRGLNKSPYEYPEPGNSGREGGLYELLSESDFQGKLKINGRSAAIYLVCWDECDFFSLIMKPTRDYPDFFSEFIKYCMEIGLDNKIPTLLEKYIERMEKSRYLQWGDAIRSRSEHVFLKLVC